MKRTKIIDTFSKDNLLIYKKRIAFHEAGHAAGIHLNNKSRQLPAVFFKIIINQMADISTADIIDNQSFNHEYIARVEGGRLIELPAAFDSIANEFINYQSHSMKLVADYVNSFEADIINLLIGPLAEAKYIAGVDNEQFNHKLVNLNALNNYGGSSDIALVSEYLNCLFIDKNQMNSKLNALFSLAFDFVSNDENWMAINELAEYIIGSNKKIIYCNDISSILDHGVAKFQNRKTNARYFYDGYAP